MLPKGRELPGFSALTHDGLTLADPQEIGREVGISPDAVAKAANALDLRGRVVSRTFLGLPIGVERTVALNRWLTDAEWGAACRRVARGLQCSGDPKVLWLAAPMDQRKPARPPRADPDRPSPSPGNSLG